MFVATNIGQGKNSHQHYMKSAKCQMNKTGTSGTGKTNLLNITTSNLILFFLIPGSVRSRPWPQCIIHARLCARNMIVRMGGSATSHLGLLNMSASVPLVRTILKISKENVKETKCRNGKTTFSKAFVTKLINSEKS